MAHRNAASVFPDPVGAITKVWSPSAMASQACDWAGVGVAKVPVNQRRVAGANRPSGPAGLTSVVDAGEVNPEVPRPAEHLVMPVRRWVHYQFR